MARPPAMAAGATKSNISMRRRPMSDATDTTSRLVDVPMVVLMPPTSVERPMGRRVREAGVPVRSATLMRTGMSSSTIGTVVDEGASTLPTTGSAAGDLWARPPGRARYRPIGSSAGRAEVPGRRSSGSTRRPAPRGRTCEEVGDAERPGRPTYGKSWNPTVSTANTKRLEDSMGIRSRVKSVSARSVEREDGEGVRVRCRGEGIEGCVVSFARRPPLPAWGTLSGGGGPAAGRDDDAARTEAPRRWRVQVAP